MFPQLNLAAVLQGPKSYNDALAKRFERKKGDMGSSSTGVKDRGIFVSADFRNPRTDQELQVSPGPMLVLSLRRAFCLTQRSYFACCILGVVVYVARGTASRTAGRTCISTAVVTR